MPGAPDDDYRMVLGEESLDWRGLTDPELRAALVAVGDLLEPLADGRQVVFMNTAWDTECLPAVTLADVLYTNDGGLPPDERRRLQALLDKCRAVEPTDDDLPRLVRRAGGEWRESSWGMAHALSRAADGRAMSCLVAMTAPEPEQAVASAWSSGWLPIERREGDDSDKVELHVLRTSEDTVGFWRGVLTRERASEGVFFALADSAFPRLLFSDTLRFQQFRGAHAEILPWLVKLLGLLNDHFAETLELCGGDQKKVQARFKAMDADISPESPNTKKNAKAWEQRNVAFRGRSYRCEWHGKRMWDRDRVHFSLPIRDYDDRVLVGIFTGHLST
ncbi:hypothetical protein [Streptomyces nitrosporeus]|uniref:hypothetical protein n=1 Tax=Streptomyces nitrosporeus TaxID=28894 RepID=UPI00399F2F00